MAADTSKRGAEVRNPTGRSKRLRQWHHQQRQSLDFGSLQALFSQIQPPPQSGSAAEEGSTGTDVVDPSLWYVLTTSVLLAFHKEQLVQDLWTYLANSGTHHTNNDEGRQHDDPTNTGGIQAQAEEEQRLLSTARKIREACLKASTLVGFPRAINALFALTSSIGQTHPHTLASILANDKPLRPSSSSSSSSFSASLAPPADDNIDNLTHSYNISSGNSSPTTTNRSPTPTTMDKSTSHFHQRGLSFFRRIYSHHTPRVLQAMDTTSGGDLTYFAINCIYGELLSEFRILGPLETGLLEFVCCLADGCGPQAKGHFFGSINLGATTTTLRATVLLAERIAEQLGMACPWKTDHHMDAAERVDFDDMDTETDSTDHDYHRDKNESDGNHGEKRDQRKDEEEYEPEPEHIFVPDFQFLDRIMAR
ncbi:hypothetical protein ABEF95_007351 [Exophiala dermatitidis]